MYSTTWCSDCRRSKKVFEAMGVDYTLIDIEQQPEYAELVKKVNNGQQSVPTIVFPDGTTLTEPSNAVLEQKLTEVLAAR
jgi:mycoredoxin